jgi:hypothetical protein
MTKDFVQRKQARLCRIRQPGRIRVKRAHIGNAGSVSKKAKPIPLQSASQNVSGTPTERDFDPSPEYDIK